MITKSQRDNLEKLDTVLAAKIDKIREDVVTASATYLNDVHLLCTQCQQPIRARINTQQWIRVEWIGPGGECLSCYQKAKGERNDAENAKNQGIVRPTER